MSLAAVRDALENQLAAITPALQTQWENVPYTPVEGTPYQRVYLLTATPETPEMGTFTRERGYMQVTLAYPLGDGSAAASARAELIRAAFKRGQTLSSAGTNVTVETTPEIAPAAIADDRYILPVKIPFYSHFNA